MVRPVGNPTVSAPNVRAGTVMSSNGQNGSERDPQAPSDGLTKDERDAFRRRAADLGAKLDTVKAEAQTKSGRRGPDDRARGTALSQAMKIAIELVVGICVGGFIGKVLDEQLGTKPWLVIVFLILGFAAGMLNVVRAAQRLQKEAEPLQRAARPAADDKDDDRTDDDGKD